MLLIHKYTAPGTFAESQSGDSENHPYRADNADDFDKIMRVKLIAEYRHIHLAAGTYLTRGLGYQDGGSDYRWSVRSNWTISGAGEGLTTIKLVEWPPATIVGPGRKWAVIGSAPESNVVIENMTVDGNWTGLNNPSHRPPPFGWAMARWVRLRYRSRRIRILAFIIPLPIRWAWRRAARSGCA